MAKIDLDALSIEELAALREHATDKLFEKVAARRAELEAELEKLAQYGKPVKKTEGAPVAKVKKADEVRGTERTGRQSCITFPVWSGAAEPRSRRASRTADPIGRIIVSRGNFV